MNPGWAYFQDIIAPQWVVHGLDFGDRQDGDTFGHIYNFIDYCFAENDREIRARHYLDEPGTALVLHEAAGDDMMMRVLVFLAMRYDAIKWMSGEMGYVPLPPTMIDIVHDRMRAHMAAHSD